jgi:diacylglycerol kinase family enzyme
VKVGVILNAAAGGGAADGADPRAEQIRAAFSAAGVEVELYESPPCELAETSRRVAASGVDAVVAAGGDGTVSAVAGALVGGDTPLAVLPLGTLNHFARDIGMPVDLAAAARVIAEARVARVDVGEVNGHTFINNSSIGLYPEIVTGRDAVQRRTGRRKWWAMLQAALRVLHRFPLLRVRVRTPGRELVARTPVVFVGNNDYSTDPGALGQRARLDAGLLSLCIMRCRGRLQLLWMMLRAILQRPEVVPGLEYDAVLEAWVSLGGKPRSLAIALDGEVVRVEAPLHYQLRRHALRVLIGPPAGSA